MTDAYLHVKSHGSSVRKVAKLLRVPVSTLRVRTVEIVSFDTLSAGAPPLFGGQSLLTV